MTVGRLVIRADGGPGIGSGHLGRCLALAEHWSALGGEVRLVTKAAPRPWADRFSALGGVVSAHAGWEREGSSWVVLDGYHLGPGDQELVRAAGQRLLVIDDHGFQGRYAADVVLDHNLDAGASDYRDVAPGTELLLGPHFALLRKEFTGTAAPNIPPEARRLLVVLGGSPPDVLVSTVASAVASTNLEVRQLRDEADVAAAMAGADVAVAGAGVTAWELCAMGVPSVLVVIAPNQAPVAEALERAGAAVSVGDAALLSAERLADEVRSLGHDHARRAELSTNARRLFDGRGPRRVAARLHGHLLELTPVQSTDARLLWEWANEPGVRRAAFSPAPIPWEDHVRWLEAQLADPATRFYLGRRGGEPIGQVRFGVDDERAEIHVSVRVEARARGVGPALISAASRRLFADTAVRTIEARIRPDNPASVAAFLDAGFRPDGEGSDGMTRWLRYSLERDAGRG